MKVLYAASEAAPFIKTGGLADVAGSLPKALVQEGVDCRVVMPLYSAIDEVFKSDMEYIGYYYVDLDWRHQYVGVYKYILDEVTFYFLDSEFYFNRFNIYGEVDDGERFLFFSKAIALLPRFLDEKFDIIHSNDWHTAMVNIFVRDFARGDDFYNDTKLVFTIHNLRYQGVFPAEIMRITGLDPNYYSEDILKFYDQVNFMKGGISFCDKLTTVSGTYAMEIKSPYFGEQLDGFIRKHQYKLSGIINGIDYDVWNPETDDLIAANYSAKNKEGKKKNKEDIQKLYGLPQRDDVPLIALVSRLNEMKGLDLIVHILDELMSEDVQFVILGTGEEEYENDLRHYSWKYPEKFAGRVYFSNEESHKIYAGADLYLMPSLIEPCGVSQLIAMRYGAVPIVRETGGLRDTVKPYHSAEKDGWGFSFANINAHDMLYTIKRALGYYWSDKFDLIMENSMNRDNSWRFSSKEYIKLYEELI